MFHLAQSHHNSWLLQGQRALGTTLFSTGELDQALTHLEQGVAMYDPHQHRSHTFLYGQDPGVACLAYAALAKWLLGYPEQARQMGQQALCQAQALSHPFSLAMTLFWSAWLHQLYPEAHITQERAKALIALAKEQGFALYAASSIIMQGWVLTMQHRHQTGIAQIRHGLHAYQNTGARVFQSYFLSLLAEAYGNVGDPRAGLTTLAEALDTVEADGEYVYAAEIHRLKGALRLQQSMDHHAEAEACFQQALNVARQQQAKSLELRAAMSLSQLWQQQGKRDAAYDLLTVVYDWFTEGFDTPDLKQAKALLDVLG